MTFRLLALAPYRLGRARGGPRNLSCNPRGARLPSGSQPCRACVAMDGHRPTGISLPFIGQPRLCRRCYRALGASRDRHGRHPRRRRPDLRRDEDRAAGRDPGRGRWGPRGRRRGWRGCTVLRPDRRSRRGASSAPSPLLRVLAVSTFGLHPRMPRISHCGSCRGGCPRRAGHPRGAAGRRGPRSPTSSGTTLLPSNGCPWR